jgi:hypothetical protein
MGNQARVADKSTVVSTSTRNFPNRLGKGFFFFKKVIFLFIVTLFNLFVYIVIMFIIVIKVYY